MKFWDYYIGSDNPRHEIMLIKKLIDWTVFGRRLMVELHCMVAADYPRCFHVHPYNAWRVPLWGGYIEELSFGFHYTPGPYKIIWPGRIGRVGIFYCHRVHSLLCGRSYSLWFHGAPTVSGDLARGDGWPDLWKSDIEIGRHPY